MGLFDFLKKKQSVQDIPVVVEENNVLKSNTPILYFDGLVNNEKIFNLLWFGDGKFKNYDFEQDNGTIFENELFRIEFMFINPEPSLLSSTLPIKISSSIDVNESIGYYPSYETLSPEQRWVYLNWLKDLRQKIDIGYVFIFYYGLERHLLYGKYKDAVDVILLLRKFHKNSSFQSYSLRALLLAAILHKDEHMLERVLVATRNNYPDNLLLIAKYLMKKDITSEEIMAMVSSVGFKNKRYINMYPDMFKDVLESKLEDAFGKITYPIYDLATDFEFKNELAFANVSLPGDIRTLNLPSIIDNLTFKDSIMNLLSSTHAELKEKLTKMRKEGQKPVPKSTVADEIEYSSVCPYCDSLLAKPPKKKKKCSQCGNFIYVRSSRILFPTTALTEDEAMANDEFYSLREYGIDTDFFFKKHEQIGSKQYTSTCVAIYEDVLLEKIELFELHSLYFRLALLNYKLGKEFVSYLQHSAKTRLMQLKNMGCEKVTILSCACDECKKSNSRVLTIDEALKERPIPHIKCSNEIENEKQGWCTCTYSPLFAGEE